mmetsp:Transcript_23351/g.49963  ORF Transcript_23351/g.49963 Transcript_23351/m.49963 type:complete len:900 (+) Transcript_23351:725-3424(+)|eukprot:CAMPEP_0172538238 /NCGR_PEP_ID=MMETSP1067-20121228/9665_1 /TAXON_ID=265564 ORGANISM="Thalassiosira punctigera, Strain Tpunct2005C2" /NCGR_SAMPLE_ID=MMETSP1067 /ASSEMBLY_ACC=CAM_ASM_000444 /LENGTH=899 /DNA_ID=CAMNT_0013323693 /DNA_START=834 /DNA_END=3533 /DNA_ORIENTATION=+
MSHHNRLPNDASFDLKVFIKDVHDTHGRKRPLTVRPWASVKDVKDQLTKHLHVPASAQCIYFGPLLSSSKELPNHRLLQDAGIYRNGETLLLEIKNTAGGSLKSSSSSISSLKDRTSDICVSSSTLDLCPKALQRLVQQARRGLTLGFKPALAPDGSGGSYFLSDARKKRVGVFKPADEEPFAENNPRGYVPHSNAASGVGGENNEEYLRQGIRPGELCLREVAAFLLDHDGFSGVPMTTLAEARHPALHTAGAHWTLSEGGAGVGVHSLQSPLAGGGNSPSTGSGAQEVIKKVGSFQEYVHAECTMDDLSPSKISVGEVHKIAILDIRLMNADRNVANILCQRIPEDPDHFRLVPIDHGYSLRSKCDVAWFDWCWLDWPQLKQPLSQVSRDYVLKLDIEEDARMLRERLNMQNDVLDYFRSSCRILKAGVQAGLTLYDICSEILCRNDPSGEIPSKVETLTTMATELAMSAVHNGRFHHATASLALEEHLATGRRCLMDQRNSMNSQSTAKFPNAPFKSGPFKRSQSSAVFSRVSSLGGESAFTDELSKIDSAVSSGFKVDSDVLSSGEIFFDSQTTKDNFKCPPPGMVQSSQSDFSEDEDNDINNVDATSVYSFTSDSPSEDCAAGEWAAALVAVADKSMDIESLQKSLLLGQKLRDRSVSESSEFSSGSSGSDESFSSDSHSKSPVGFWHVRPGSKSIDNDTSEDDKSICWTPSLQSSGHPVNPTDSLLSVGKVMAPPCLLNVDKDLGPPSILSPSGFSASNLRKLLMESSPALDESSHPSNADDEFGPITPPPATDQGDAQPVVTSFSSFKPMKKTLCRSMSYSAFSTYKTTLAPNTDMKPKQFSNSTARRNSISSAQENDLFRTYFMKFVDLLVVRETERLVHSKEAPNAETLA